MKEKPVKILLVEDNPSDAEALKEMLQSSVGQAFEVLCKDRLSTALKTLSKEEIDLVLLDLFLPETKGLATLKKVFGKAAHVPIVVLTRFDDEGVGVEAVREGAQDYLVKGQMDKNLLLRAIRHAMERHRAEEAIRINTKQLEAANIQLQEADRLKSVFLANMSHELRSPLNSIIGFTSLILEGVAGEINDDQRKHLAMVKKSGVHLLSLINELLDVSKIEAGKIKVSPEEFKIGDVIKEVGESLMPLVNNKDLKLHLDFPEDLVVSTDKMRLKQILMNLVTNSVKFTEKGSSTIMARVSEDGKLEVSIRDTGIGIREEDMGMLFVPFHQIDMSLTKKYQGTGLGLHLSKKLANLLGGEISATSTYGEGSVFTLLLPLEYKGELTDEEDIGGRRQ